jgi:hypothetical protein
MTNLSNCHDFGSSILQLSVSFQASSKNHKIVKNSPTYKATEKISRDMESFNFRFFLMYVWLNLKKSNFTW